MNFINPTIVLVAFNRPKALSRLITSIALADYSGYENIRLAISIDGEGENFEEVVQIANSFAWRNGEKVILKNSKNIGLRKHIIACGNLTEKFQNIIILEEDCFVSKNFYDFACESLKFYGGHSSITGISLYTYSFFESLGMPFKALNDGYFTYFTQVPSSLGQIWTKDQWARFKKYYDTSPIIEGDELIPEKVKTWPDSSWKKFFYKFMVENDLFFVYPQYSFLTNFGDIGTNFLNPTQQYQVPLECSDLKKNYNFASFDLSNNKYDAFFELLPDCLIALGAKIDNDTCVDLMGGKHLAMYKNKYALSIKSASKVIKTYSNQLLPPSQNLLTELEGHFFCYGFREDFRELSFEKKMDFIASQDVTIFEAAKRLIISSKTYKVGFYLLNPRDFCSFILRNISKSVKSSFSIR